MCTVAMTGQFRLFAAVSTDFAVALRYCGVSVLCCIVFSGYLLSVDKLISDVPWVGWIAVRAPNIRLSYTVHLTLASSIPRPPFLLTKR